MHFKLVHMYPYPPEYSTSLVFVCCVWSGELLDIVCHQTTRIDVYSTLISLAAQDGPSDVCWRGGSVWQPPMARVMLAGGEAQSQRTRHLYIDGAMSP